MRTKKKGPVVCTYGTPDSTAGQSKCQEQTITSPSGGGKPMADDEHGSSNLASLQTTATVLELRQQHKNGLRFQWPKAILRSELYSTTRHVLLTLGTYMNPTGWCNPSQAQLALDCGLSERTVSEHLRMAEAAGWVKSELRRTRSNPWPNKCYQSVIPGPYALQQKLRPNDTGNPNLALPQQEFDANNQPKHVPSNNTQNNNKDTNSAREMDSADDAFGLLWNTFPCNPMSNKLAAYGEWQKLSLVNRDVCFAAALTFAMRFKQEPSSDAQLAEKLTFTPHLSNWLRRRPWLS